MSLHPGPIAPIPEETARVAHAAFPKGNSYMQMREVLGAIYEDEQFASLFAPRGYPAEAPWRLALVTVMQFAEGLSDRQAAEAVRARIDWKYTLGLELTDPGFDFSILSEFRRRLVRNAAELVLLDAVLAQCKARGFLKARGRQRTDSTHVLGVLRVLNRLELVSETLRAALNAVALAAPEWLRAWTPSEWFERYGRRIEESRLPQGKEDRQRYATLVGADGMALLERAYAPTAPAALRSLAAVETLRQVWIAQYVALDGQIQLRDPKNMPPAAAEIETPYEVEARYGEKRGHPWVGYKVHLTETCEAALPQLVTQVETTIATAADVEQLTAIQRGLARNDLLPAEHLVDGGYMRGRNLLTSREGYAIDLIGPVPEDHSWQAQAGHGFALADFAVDWEAQMVTCPQGCRSARWLESRTARDRTMIHVQFAAEDCAACPVRPLCTRARAQPRCLTLQVRAEHEAIQAARARQQAEAFAALYAARAGVEGTLSQGVRAFGLRKARYRGLAKTHLQDVATAAALNISRLTAWLNKRARARTRTSPFAALAAAG